MTGIFEGLTVIGDPVSDEDRVVHLLASLPDPFNMFVTALEANLGYQKWRLSLNTYVLHEEQKLKNWEESEGGQTKVMTPAVFNQIGRPGHLKHNCQKLAFEFANADKQDKSGFKAKKEVKHKANNATSGHRNVSNSSSDDDALEVCHSFSRSNPGRWTFTSSHWPGYCVPLVVSITSSVKK